MTRDRPGKINPVEAKHPAAAGISSSTRGAVAADGPAHCGRGACSGGT
jgi:hypothetical protein